jgi:hypothetical protein
MLFSHYNFRQRGQESGAVLLVEGRISAEETSWLRRMLFADGKIKDEERKFLHDLKGEAKETSPEFETLFKESMKAPQEQHTSGHG